MLSSKARMMRFLLKNRHLLKGKLRPETVDKNTSIEKLRADTEEGAKRLAKPAKGICYVIEEGAPMYAEWVRPDGSDESLAVLYFHGGGFVMGSALSHRNIVSGFAKRLNVQALTFDYRLAPEHPAPAAAEDGATMYRYLLKNGFQPEQIAFAGDSAGGGVALSTLLKLKDEGVPLPAACALFSPCTDMTLSGASHKTRIESDPCTPRGSSETFLAYYVGQGDARHPYASPLFGELGGLPPTIIQVGDFETLLDDSVRLAERLKEAGVETHIRVWDGLFHCFPLLAPAFPEATEALEEVCAFLRQKLQNNGSV